MALVTYHGPRPEITASFPMRGGDVLTFANGRPSEIKKPGPHSYVLPRDHAVPVGILFALGLALWVRQREGLWLTVRMSPRDWTLACAAHPRLVLFTPRMLLTPRRRRLLQRLLRRRRERMTVRTRRFGLAGAWPRVVLDRWDTSALRASATRNLSVNEEPAWRAE